MKYTKPQVLTTLNAGVVIQSGNDQASKMSLIVPDQLHTPSTTSAYEADE
jgi:hypothetical protein